MLAFLVAMCGVGNQSNHRKPPNFGRQPLLYHMPVLGIKSNERQTLTIRADLQADLV